MADMAERAIGKPPFPSGHAWILSPTLRYVAAGNVNPLKRKLSA